MAFRAEQGKGHSTRSLEKAGHKASTSRKANRTSARCTSHLAQYTCKCTVHSAPATAHLTVPVHCTPASASARCTSHTAPAQCTSQCTCKWQCIVHQHSSPVTCHGEPRGVWRVRAMESRASVPKSSRSGWGMHPLLVQRLMGHGQHAEWGPKSAQSMQKSRVLRVQRVGGFSSMLPDRAFFNVQLSVRQARQIEPWRGYTLAGS
eukprot:1136144-Pelagomonas_calceolata.AAC.11